MSELRARVDAVTFRELPPGVVPPMMWPVCVKCAECIRGPVMCDEHVEQCQRLWHEDAVEGFCRRCWHAPKGEMCDEHTAEWEAESKQIAAARDELCEMPGGHETLNRWLDV